MGDGDATRALYSVIETKWLLKGTKNVCKRPQARENNNEHSVEIQGYMQCELGQLIIISSRSPLGFLCPIILQLLVCNFDMSVDR